jgi:hypothetical protein
MVSFFHAEFCAACAAQLEVFAAAAAAVEGEGWPPGMFVELDTARGGTARRGRRGHSAALP